MTGQILIHLMFGLAVGSTLSYLWAFAKSDPRMAQIGRVLFTILTFGLIANAGILIGEILQHNFSYTYVWNYSSRELPLHLLIATFYSGQEGSFLLWTLLVAIIGLILMPYARKHGYETSAMGMYGLILVFLTLLLVAKNPFSLYTESFAAQGVTASDIPPNGKGLNPLLHNAWITIHPPILFSGFAAMSVSFAFAMAGLLKREYHSWINVALPWTLFATAILGFGIMLGGFWAYETLGWGGFWGWDPVENSSLIPWLVSVALVHTMLVQRRTRGLVKTNMVLAVFAFVMVLYSTFLTRSGVLGDTSVHSFVDPGKFAFWILLAFMLTFIAIGVGLVVSRRKDMNINREEFAPKTREFMLSIGAALVMASAVFVTVGTSWPVILEVIGQPKIAVPIKFYDNIHLVLMPLVLVVNALSLLMQWRNTSAGSFKKNLSIAAIASGVLTLITVIIASLEWPSLILAATAWFALIVNLQTGWTIIRKGVAQAGAYISHTGIALLVFGVITTSQYAETHHAVLVEGVPTEVAGYELTFLGKEQIEKHFPDREKFQYHVNIKGNGEDRTVSAVLYWSDYNRRQSAFLEPGIRWGVLNDLYISPKATEDEDVWHSTTMLKEATIADPITEDATLTFNRFLNPMELGEAEDGRMQLGADITAISAEGDTVNVQAITRLVMGGPSGPQYDPIWAEVPGTSTAIALTKVSRNNDDLTKSTADFSFRDTSKPLPTPREIFTVDFSVKPLISLVWIGVITMVLGFTFSIVRYTRLLKAATEKQTSA